ncbi:MAG: universal stress protein [Vicinamibacterales bacterium]
MSIRHILCPIDFSDASTKALALAAAVARAYGARLTALHVRPTVVPHPDIPIGGPMAPWLVTELDALRQRAADACRDVAGTGVEFDATATAGEPVHDILDRAAALSVDLIVMGTHGIGGFQHLLLGSVTEKVLRKASCPVLTVPPGTHAPAGPLFTRLICGVDFSDCSQTAATYAASMAKASGSALTLLHVIEWPWRETAGPEIEGVPTAQAQAIVESRRYLEASANERLDTLAASVMPTGAATTHVRFGKPYRELLDAARDAGADLIVLGVRGRSSVDLAFFGSTASHVVRAATCPVLTIRGA